MTAPENAPALVLAVPGSPSPAVHALADEVLTIAACELPGLNARIGYLEGSSDVTSAGDPSPSYLSLQAELKRAAAKEHAEGTPAAVIVPLLAGPKASVLRQIRQAAADSGAAAELTDVLGPHPLLAEALHVRLSEAGLARADRARLFTVATAADGIILATAGGEEAVRAAGVTGLLLAARLAVPVLAAVLDVEGAIAHTAQQLRSSGSGRLALAPYLIGPELGDGLIAAAAQAAGCAAAEALGSYPAVGRLVLNRYTTALGIAPRHPQGPQSTDETSDMSSGRGGPR